MSMASYISSDNGGAVIDRVTYAVAGGAATNWLWWPWLENGLQILLTVMGIAWLGMQMFYKWRNNRRTPD